MQSFRFLRWFNCLMACCIAASSAAFETCVDVNAPINTETGAIAQQIQPAVIAQLRTDRVRVNCILGPWSSPEDTTLHSGKTWFQTYDKIVDDFRAQGLGIYMLIGGQAVNAGKHLNSTAYCDQYAANFEAIVAHFKDRVTVYESFNEPNDWAGGTTAQVEPRYFAYMLQEIYLNVKYRHGHNADPSWNVTLVSGPLLTHDIGGTGDLGDTYFTAAATTGLHGDPEIPGLDWNKSKSLTGTYPVDGIGYHIYVCQDTTSTAQIAQRINLHLNSMMNAISKIEGSTSHTKKLWVSEIGWTTNNAGLDGQATNLDTAFTTLRADSRVQMATWFCLADFDVNNAYGLCTDNALLESQRKPAWSHLQQQRLRSKTR